MKKMQHNVSVNDDVKDEQMDIISSHAVFYLLNGKTGNIFSLEVDLAVWAVALIYSILHFSNFMSLH